MVDYDELRRLIASGVGAAKVAEDLGVSRQRVYQLADKQGIKFPRAYRKRGVRPPKPRLMTGGVPVTVSHSVAGKVSEILAAADLLARGYQVFLPIYANKGHDILASQGDRIISIEVRSAIRSASGSLRFQKKAECKSDHYALVVTGEPVSYEPDLPELKRSEE